MNQEKIFCHLWSKEKHQLRFIPSWNTTKEDIEAVKAVLTSLP